MSEWNYIIMEKVGSEFQKALNQWKHQFEFKIIWMSVNVSESLMEPVYYALIKRRELEDFY